MLHAYMMHFQTPKQALRIQYQSKKTTCTLLSSTTWYLFILQCVITVGVNGNISELKMQLTLINTMIVDTHVATWIRSGFSVAMSKC